MSAGSKTEDRNPKLEIENQKTETPVQFLTRVELAEVLRVSVRTVDTMLAGGELPHLRIHGNFIRFNLPDVIRHLTATGNVSKRRNVRQKSETRVKPLIHADEGEIFTGGNGGNGELLTTDGTDDADSEQKNGNGKRVKPLIHADEGEILINHGEHGDETANAR